MFWRGDGFKLMFYWADFKIAPLQFSRSVILSQCHRRGVSLLLFSPPEVCGGQLDNLPVLFIIYLECDCKSEGLTPKRCVQYRISGGIFRLSCSRWSCVHLILYCHRVQVKRQLECCSTVFNRLTIELWNLHCSRYAEFIENYTVCILLF